MTMSSFLFDKPIEEISLSDVQNLKTRQVAEGLYAEYKSDFPTSRKISHSIASFANTHGGWYFIGIKTDANNVPEDFDGFNLSEHTKPKEEIRDVIVGNINPIPLFYSKLLEIGGNKGILIVNIPESDESPHVTKDGRIYRRNAEGSDPVPETDRYTIDKMYEKGKRFDDLVDKFCQHEFTVSKAQEEQGWLEIYFLTYPLNKLSIKDFFKMQYSEEIRKFFNEQIKLFDVVTLGIPFDNLSTSQNSLILRQTNPESLPLLTLTFEYFKNGNARIIVPLMYVDPLEISESAYASSKSLEKLNSMLKEEDPLHPLYRIVDGWKLFTTYMILSGKYVELLKKAEWKDSILAKCHLVNTWRNVVFFDSDFYVHHLDAFGAPVCLGNEFDIPNLPTRNFLKQEMPQENHEIVLPFIDSIECLGFHPEALVEMTKDWANYLQKMQPKTS